MRLNDARRACGAEQCPAADGVALRQVFCHLRTNFELLKEQVGSAIEFGAFAALQRERCMWIGFLNKAAVAVAEQRVGSGLHKQRDVTRRA